MSNVRNALGFRSFSALLLCESYHRERLFICIFTTVAESDVAYASTCWLIGIQGNAVTNIPVSLPTGSRAYLRRAIISRSRIDLITQIDSFMSMARLTTGRLTSHYEILFSL